MTSLLLLGVVLSGPAMTGEPWLTWSGDPTTSMTVSWAAPASLQNPAVEYRPKGGSWKRMDARLFAMPMAAPGRRAVFRAKLSGLMPHTNYTYRVGQSGAWSDSYAFKTPSPDPLMLTFLYLGDAQAQIERRFGAVMRTAWKTAPEAQFAIHAGDLVDQANSPSEWREWFTAVGPVHAQIPMLPVAGNHEYGRQGGFTRFWDAQFGLPRNGIAGLESTNYQLDVQGVRILVLNSNVKLKEQAAWLERNLRTNSNAWTVVSFHHPIYSLAKGRDNPRHRALLQPILEKFNVDLVLQGHDHTYGRVHNPRGSGTHGPVYLVSNAGAKMYRIDAESARRMRKTGEQQAFFQVIKTTGSRLTYQAYTEKGAIFDQFILERGTDGRKRLIEGRSAQN